MKGLVEEKTSFGGDDVVVAGSALINSVLTSSNPLLRCAAGECLGRIAQVRGRKEEKVSTSQFLSCCKSQFDATFAAIPRLFSSALHYVDE